MLAERLLAPMRDADVDALLLGCTHYPYLARVIGDVMGPDVTLVSARPTRPRSRRAPTLGRARPAARRPADRRRATASCRAATSPGSPISAAACSAPSSTHAERWPIRCRTSIDCVPRLTPARRRTTGAPMTRPDGRAADELRPITFERDYTEMAAGSRARHVRPHPRAVHRVDRRGRAALDAGQRQGLGDRRVLDAARLVARARRPRGGQGQAERAHGRDPAPDRPLAARRVRHALLGERQVVVDCDVLQADGGTRTASHLRRLPRAARRARPGSCRRGAIARPPAALVLRGDQRRHRRRRAGARPALRRGLARPRST